MGVYWGSFAFDLWTWYGYTSDADQFWSIFSMAFVQ